MKRLEGSGWKISYVVIHKFQLEILKVFHSQERGVSLLNQQLSFFKSTNLQWTPLNTILQDFTIATKPTSLLYSRNTRKYEEWKASVRCLLFNPKNGDLLWQSPTVWVQLDTSFPRYLYFQENVRNKNWWTAYRLNQTTRAISRGGQRARF